MIHTLQQPCCQLRFGSQESSLGHQAFDLCVQSGCQEGPLPTGDCHAQDLFGSWHCFAWPPTRLSMINVLSFLRYIQDTIKYISYWLIFYLAIFLVGPNDACPFVSIRTKWWQLQHFQLEFFWWWVPSIWWPLAAFACLFKINIKTKKTMVPSKLQSAQGWTLSWWCRNWSCSRPLGWQFIKLFKIDRLIDR